MWKISLRGGGWPSRGHTPRPGKTLDTRGQRKDTYQTWGVGSQPFYVPSI
jgi:hypothetical protein